MILRHILILFSASYPLFILMDILCLGIVMAPWYREKLGYFIKISESGALEIRWGAALLVWALVVLGAILLVFPHAQGKSLSVAFCWGAFYGLVLYGVYDLTNYALFDKWSLFITCVDIAWGTAVNGFLLVLLSLLHKHLL